MHGVDVEGMQLGIDDALVETLGRWSPLPVTYAGGARTIVSKEGAGHQQPIWPRGLLLRLHRTLALPKSSLGLKGALRWRHPLRCDALAAVNDHCRTVAPLQEDLERVRVSGLGRVDITVGSALDVFGGKLPYDEVVAWHRRQQQQE